MSRKIIVVATTALALSGCTPSEPPASPAPAGETRRAKQHRLENLKAECMKTKGFRYIPWVIQEKAQTKAEKKYAEGDYAAMRSERAKYGFYIYYSYIFTKDERGDDLIFYSPNNALTEKLSKTQQEAWGKASEECFAQAAKAVYNKASKGESDFWQQWADLGAQMLARELNGDTQLVNLGRKFGDCLKAKGYPVPSLQPTELAGRGAKATRDEATALALEEPGTKKKLEEGQFRMPTLSAAEAEPYLKREIKAALDDLDCGRDFYAVYQPKKGKIQRRANDEFGLGAP